MQRKRTGLALLSLAGLILATLGAMAVPVSAAAPSTLGASIGTAVVKPDPVVRSSGLVTITATVTGTYSAEGAPSAVTVGTYVDTIGPLGTCTKGPNTYAMSQSAPASYTVVTYVDKGLTVDGEIINATTAEVSDTVDLTGLADGTRSATVDATVQAFQTRRTTTFTTTYYRHWDGTRSACGVESTDFVEAGHTDEPRAYSTATTLSASDSYVLDLVAPVVEASFSGGGAAEAPTGGSINANIKISQGTPSDPFTLTLAAYLDGAAEDAPPAFSGTAEGTIGNNGQEYFASIGLDVPCSAALGTYNLVATASGLTDRGGSDFPDVVTPVGAFEVVPSTNLVGTTQVFGWVDIDGDGLPDYTNLDATGFTATQGGKAINTSPGAFFATSLLKATGQCAGQMTMNFASGSNDSTADVTLTAPTGFAFVITGKLYTRVYAGKDVKGTLFDWERPGLVGVTSTGDVTSLLGANYEVASPSTNPTQITVRLGRLTYWQDANHNQTYGDAGDILVKGGALPADWKVFVKVRLRYVGSSLPSMGLPGHPFIGTVHVDGYNGVLSGESKSNTYYLIRTA